MDLTAYERLVKTENAARKYLLGFCFENHQRFCPRCKGKKLYRLADDRRRCSSCRYTFHDFSGRWINQGNLTAGQWLRLIKLFELGLCPEDRSAAPPFLQCGIQSHQHDPCRHPGAFHRWRCVPSRRSRSGRIVFWRKAKRETGKGCRRQSPCFRHSGAGGTSLRGSASQHPGKRCVGSHGQESSQGEHRLHG